MTAFEEIKKEATDVMDVATEFKSEESKDAIESKASELLEDVKTLNAAELVADAKDVVKLMEDHAQVGEAVKEVVKEGGDVVADIANIAGVFADGKVTPEEVPVLFTNVSALAHDIPEAVASLLHLKSDAEPVIAGVTKEAGEVVAVANKTGLLDAMKNLFWHPLTFDSWKAVGSAVVGLFYSSDSEKAPEVVAVEVITTEKVVPELSPELNSDLTQPTETTA